jgi:chromosome segregation ATPase
LESNHADHINTVGGSLNQILEIQSRLDALAASENRCSKSVYSVQRHILQLKDKFKETQQKLKTAEKRAIKAEEEIIERSSKEKDLREKIMKLQSDNFNIKRELKHLKDNVESKLKVN